MNYHLKKTRSANNFLFAIGLLTNLGFFSCHAQNNQPTRFWLSPGIGRANFPCVMVAAAVEPANTQSAIIGRFSVNGELIPPSEPGIKTGEWGVLYGRRVKNFLFSAGLSYVYGNYRGRYLYTDPDPFLTSGKVYEFVGYKTIGIPAEVRYMATLKHIGIGLTAFGNLNDKRSFAGLNVSLYFGKLK